MTGPEGSVTLFASCAPGLEPALLVEARALPGVLGAAAEPGGVLLAGPPALLGEANLRLRSATRVLLRLGRFHVRRLERLIDAVAALPWERYLRSAAISPSVTCRRCRIYHSGAATERLQRGVAARLGVPPVLGKGGEGAAAERDGDPDAGVGGAPRVLLRGEDDEWEVSLDSSGELLHRRGYRKEQGEAPLRESLAAGLLLLAGYEGGPLLDLCTGSGTFAIEAGLLARRLWPGLLRRFAFEDWPLFSPAQLSRQREAARGEALPPAPGDAPTILGLDLDGRQVERAADNARRAGLGAEVAFRQQDLFAAAGYRDFLLEQGGAGLFVTANPPYGHRIGPSFGAGAASAVVPFYRRLGRHLRAQVAAAAPGGARVLVLCGHPAGAAALGLDLPSLRLQNGGLSIDAVHGPLRG